MKEVNTNFKGGSEDQDEIAEEVLADAETEDEIASTLPYKLILGLIVLAVAIFFLYIFISSISKH